MKLRKPSAECTRQGGPAPVTGGTYVTLDKVAGIVQQILPQADIDLDIGPDPTDDIQQCFDTSARPRRDLNYRPAVSLEDGIRRYSAWLASRRAAL